MKILLSGLAAGAITVLICTSKAGERLRNLGARIHPLLGYLLNCCFCTSWWVSLAMLDKFSIKEWAATVTIANIAVLLIHLSIATMEKDDVIQEETSTSPV